MKYISIFGCCTCCNDPRMSTYVWRRGRLYANSKVPKLRIYLMLAAVTGYDCLHLVLNHLEYYDDVKLARSPGLLFTANHLASLWSLEFIVLSSKYIYTTVLHTAHLCCQSAGSVLVRFNSSICSLCALAHSLQIFRAQQFDNLAFFGWFPFASSLKSSSFWEKLKRPS